METRGRKPLPEGKKKPPQATVKINDFILPFVRQLKGNLKKGQVTTETIKSLFAVLKGKKLTVDNQPLKEANIKLVLERDKEHLRAVKLGTKVRSLEATIKRLKIDHDALLHQEYNCMAIKANGKRCTKKAVVDAILNGINIHVCLQHSKILANKAE